MWQVTSRSSEVGFSPGRAIRAISALTLPLWACACIILGRHSGRHCVSHCVCQVSRKSSSRRYRVPSLRVAPRTAVHSSSSQFRRVRSEASLGVAVRANAGDAATTDASRAAGQATFRPAVPTGARQPRRRIQSANEYRRTQRRLNT